MWKYIVKRVLWLIPIILAVAITIFSIMYFVPGDPAVIKLGPNAQQWQYEEAREAMGLNDPYIVRLGNYLSDVFLHFDFGDSLTDGTSVTDALLERLPRTFVIAILSTIFGGALGIPLGISAATHPNSLRDQMSMFIAIIGISIPSFWLALMLVLLFSIILGWLPAQGLGGIEYYILPCISAGMMTLAESARHTRAMVVEQMRSDYVITARAKGAKEKRVVYKHVLPNASIPIVTQLFSGLGQKMAGAMIIEQIFGIPGIGMYMIRAINNRDYIAVQGAVIFFSIILSIVMLLTDIVYAYIDPRIKAQFEGSSSHRRKRTTEQEGA